MTGNYGEIAKAIDDFEQVVMKDNLDHLVVNIHTVFADQTTTVQRNALISRLRYTFITETGHVNTPALLLFCHGYDIKYSSLPMGAGTGFIIIYGKLSIEVRPL